MEPTTISVQKQPNLELLTQQIQAVWPDCRVGFLGDAMDVVLYFAADPSDADIAQAQQICAAHDPTKKTAAQQQSAAQMHNIAQFLPQAAAMAAYFAALTPTSPDVLSGAANMKAYALLATLMVVLPAWVNPVS